MLTAGALNVRRPRESPRGLMPQTLRKAEFIETRLQGRDKRRGVRLNSRVPVTIEWDGAAGEAFREQVHTRVVGPYGCLLVLPVEIQVGKAVHVTNLAD